MTDLIVCLTDEKATAHVSSLIKSREWGSIFLIMNPGRNFDCGKKAEMIHVDFSKPVFEVIERIKKSLDGKLSDFEVAFNMVSGSGKEHMAVLAALLKLGVGIRLVAVTKEGVREL